MMPLVVWYEYQEEAKPQGPKQDMTKALKMHILSCSVHYSSILLLIEF